jgi:hypothetical protein
MKDATESLNFIEHIIEEDLANGFPKEKLCFRFPPEPNGYLHIGHAASICLNFGLGEKYNAPVNLRFDDTNPAKEEQEYVDAIKRDISWLGFKWANECYSSDYFQQLYDWAVRLIKQGKAYVDQQSSEQIAEQKGTPTSPGTPSPFRDRSLAENLETCTCAIQFCTASFMRTTIAPEILGIFTPCTIGLMESQITSNRFHIHFVPLSLKPTENCTIGTWIRLLTLPCSVPSNVNLRVET